MALGIVFLSTFIAVLAAGISAILGAGLISILVNYVVFGLLSSIALVALLIARELYCSRHISAFPSPADGPPPR